MILGAGPLGNGRVAPPGVNDAPVICGAVLSMRNASVSDADSPGSGGESGWPDHDRLHVLEPFRQEPKVAVKLKAPLASVVTDRS